jgi:predicted acyltransferase
LPLVFSKGTSQANSLKGQCNEMDLFIKGLNILTRTFCVCACTKSTYFIISFQKIFISWHNPFNGRWQICLGSVSGCWSWDYVWQQKVVAKNTQFR